jgi:hypothetical protein
MQEPIQCTLIEKKEVKLVGAKESLSLPGSLSNGRWITELDKIPLLNFQGRGMTPFDGAETSERRWVLVRGQKCHAINRPKRKRMSTWGTVPASMTWWDKGGIPCEIPRTYLDGNKKQKTCSIKAGYTLAMLCYTTRMNKVMFVSVEPWKTYRHQVRMWLVVATRLQTQQLSFRLHTLSNTSSVQKGCYNSILLPLPKEMTFSILQSWLEKRLGESAQFKIRLQFGQLIN